eukprot:m.253376 g.253376  ORF g.253376 m.253376 type:complete len:795 (+) comp18305_c0_seq1:43-2427(+)
MVVLRCKFTLAFCRPMQRSHRLAQSARTVCGRVLRAALVPILLAAALMALQWGGEHVPGVYRTITERNALFRVVFTLQGEEILAQVQADKHRKDFLSCHLHVFASENLLEAHQVSGALVYLSSEDLTFPSVNRMLRKWARCLNATHANLQAFDADHTLMWAISEENRSAVKAIPAVLAELASSFSALPMDHYRRMLSFRDNQRGTEELLDLYNSILIGLETLKRIEGVLQADLLSPLDEIHNLPKAFQRTIEAFDKITSIIATTPVLAQRYRNPSDSRKFFLEWQALPHALFLEPMLERMMRRLHSDARDAMEKMTDLVSQVVTLNLGETLRRIFDMQFEATLESIWANLTRVNSVGLSMPGWQYVRNAIHSSITNETIPHSRHTVVLFSTDLVALKTQKSSSFFVKADVHLLYPNSLGLEFSRDFFLNQKAHAKAFKDQDYLNAIFHAIRMCFNYGFIIPFVVLEILSVLALGYSFPTAIARLILLVANTLHLVWITLWVLAFNVACPYMPRRWVPLRPLRVLIDVESISGFWMAALVPMELWQGLRGKRGSSICGVVSNNIPVSAADVDGNNFEFISTEPEHSFLRIRRGPLRLSGQGRVVITPCAQLVQRGLEMISLDGRFDEGELITGHYCIEGTRASLDDASLPTSPAGIFHFSPNLSDALRRACDLVSVTAREHDTMVRIRCDFVDGSMSPPRVIIIPLHDEDADDLLDEAIAVEHPLSLYSWYVSHALSPSSIALYRLLVMRGVADPPRRLEAARNNILVLVAVLYFQWPAEVLSGIHPRPCVQHHA